MQDNHRESPKVSGTEAELQDESQNERQGQATSLNSAGESEFTTIQPAKSLWWRYALVSIGWISVFLGVLGIFLPVLPTTPFLLLAAACFVRSSPRFYQWLVDHPKLGKYIIYYLEGKGIPKRAKWMAISMIWVTISLSALLVVPIFWVKVLLFMIAISVSIYILKQPTWEPDTEQGHKP